MSSATPSSVFRWSTDEVPPGQRFDYYADALSSSQTPMSLSSENPSSFMAKMELAELGALSLMRQIGSGNRATRGARDIARSTERSFHLLVNLASPWTLEHVGRTRLRPGDAILADSAFGYDLDLPSAYDVVHIKLSETWLRQWLPAPGVLVGRSIPFDSGWGRALTSFVAELSPKLVSESVLPAAVVSQHVGALLSIIADEASRSGERPTLGQKGLRPQIIESIAQRCSEGLLTAESVAMPLGISTRTLHRSLAAVGLTFGAALISARAQLAMRMIESPLHRRLTLAEIGRRAGFLDASHFTRVIRAREGQTPSELRRSLASSRSADRHQGLDRHE